MKYYNIVAHIINKIVRFTFKILGFFSTLFTIFAPWEKSAKLPPIESYLLKISAEDLSKKIRNKEVRCVDVINTFISRIKDVNPFINSIVEERFSEAIKEARNIDELLVNFVNIDWLAQNKPLLGVPLTVKEVIAVKDMSNNGARSRIPSNVAEEDADCIKLLRNAGAIILLVSNTPELCLYFETYNPTYGRTNNPYDTRRTCAGSSGGEAALLGAGASVIGIGSDVAGSLRFPAMFCGVYSHKPTPGFVSNNGHIPTSDDPMWDQYFTIGPMARFANDLPLMLKNMIPEGNKKELLALNDEVDLSKIKVYYMYGEGHHSTLQREPNFQVKLAVKYATDLMRQTYGCVSSKVNLTYFKNSLSLTTLILQMRGLENVYQKSNENPDDYDTLRVIDAIIKKLTFQSSASISAVLFGPLRFIIGLAPNEMKKKIQLRAEYVKHELMELLNDNGVLIYPTFPTEAPFHNRMSGHIMDVSYSSIFNVIGFPVTQCPIKFTREGLPVGVQIVASPKMDRLSLAVAKALEPLTGGWRPPEDVK